ncbi:MAG: hypothetical protein B2I18_04875 [Cuniculiplasma sp. C_DKE]|nr:MAG: hypothetical protein B2I18_04875 [Cuniculiplasma sp. C_DKE]
MKGGMLNYWIMRNISEGPLKGADIIKEMSRKSNGRWRPSPGSVYPALSHMEEKGFVKRDNDGRYSITEEGRNEMKKYDDMVKNLIGTENVNDILEETTANLTYIIETFDYSRFDPSKINDMKTKIMVVLEKIKESED